MKLFASSSLTRRALLVLATVFFAASPFAHAGKKPADLDFSGDAAATPTPTPPKFDVPIPVHRDVQGMRLPYFTNTGKLQMYFVIEKALRVDLDHLLLKNAYMQTYDEKENPDATVFMTVSTLDLNTRIVTSDVPVTVRRSDFEIVGRKMVFNTQRRAGRMTGHVHMIIYNRQEMNSSSPSPSPAKVLSTAAAHPSATP